MISPPAVPRIQIPKPKSLFVLVFITVLFEIFMFLIPASTRMPADGAVSTALSDISTTFIGFLTYIPVSPLLFTVDFEIATAEFSA